jgi:hypothetical protein
MGVRATALAPLPQPAGSGRDYLAGKLERRRAAKRIADDLDAHLAGVVHASALRVATEPTLAFSGAYLVDRGRIAEFERVFEAARKDLTGLELACSGPWPPFSFANVEEAA